MKKGLKTTLIVTGSVAGALILTIIILSAIIVQPLKQFTQLDYNVNVANTPLTTQNQAYESEIKSELSSVRFSVMRSILEFSTDYAIKPVTYTVDDEQENRRLLAANFLSLTPMTNQYMLRFSFNTDKTLTNKSFVDKEGELIKFDSLIIIINKSSGRLQPVTLYPYISGNLNNALVGSDGFPLDTPDENGRINSTYYYVYEFSAKMNTSSLYDFLEDSGFATGSAGM